ncbi:GntR family transcriptional regulator [Planctomicrobium sp. SH664]|uniref:GntR family transcriptional regulator n=1 Tax=Planctomicrobium sp. SH664 TaxID=3448125 RepID=UPI003F5AE3F6
MSSHISSEPRAQQIARQIEEDLRGRNLAVGAPYLGTDQVAQMFGIHLRTAHRALNVLAERNLLIRKRGAGTFVGPALEAEAVSPGVVHVLISASRAKRGINESALLAALREHLPGVGVQINLLPGSGAEVDAASALGVSLAAGVAKGVVLIGCDRPVQDYIAKLGIPAVVFGGVFATASGLASIDSDHCELGRVLAEQLVQRGHREIAVLMHDIWLPGDNRFFEGISQVLAASDARCVMRSTQVDAAALKAEARAMVEQEPGITAAICRSRFRYENFAPAFRSLATRAGRDSSKLDVVFDDAEYSGPCEDIYACAEMPVVQQLNQVGVLLQSLIQNDKGVDRHVLLPVRLVPPERETMSSSDLDA